MTDACCGSEPPKKTAAPIPLPMAPAGAPAGGDEQPPPWVTGRVSTPAGDVPRITAAVTLRDRLGHLRSRVSNFRMSYTVPPGLYALGDPGPEAHVFVSANYQLSFDALRRSLTGEDAWILVLDTRGINVWCAAGKGTFGTDELVRRLGTSRLAEVVSHRRLIVPQLGAPGVSAPAVRERTGFRVKFGPVRATDIPAYLAAGGRADAGMRRVRFPLKDRLILTPMELIPALRHAPLFAVVTLLVFGLQSRGIIFRDAWTGGAPFLLYGLLAAAAGAVITPAFLFHLPSRAFAVKGWIAGLAVTAAALLLPVAPRNFLLVAFCFVFFPGASSYIALQFTGSTPYTGMSGVKKELRVALPLYLAGTAVSLVLLSVFKLREWGLL